MRRSVAVVGCASLLAVAALSLGSGSSGTVRAAQAGEATFLIPANDGYGIAECIATGSECGKVVATAWCEAQGYASATTFGVAKPEDATGSTPASEAQDERPLTITCAR